MKEDDDRVRVGIKYVVLSGSESHHNYPMLRSDREQGFFVFARAPGRSRFAVNVYVRSEHRYGWEMESVVRVREKDFNIPVLNSYHTQERFSRGGGGDVSDKYPAKVEEYERTDTTALDGLPHQEVTVLAILLPKLTTHYAIETLTIIRAPVCQFHTTRVSSWSFQSVLRGQSSAS